MLYKFAKSLEIHFPGSLIIFLSIFKLGYLPCPFPSSPSPLYTGTEVQEAYIIKLTKILNMYYMRTGPTHASLIK